MSLLRSSTKADLFFNKSSLEETKNSKFRWTTPISNASAGNYINGKKTGTSTYNSLSSKKKKNCCQ